MQVLALRERHRMMMTAMIRQYKQAQA